MTPHVRPAAVKDDPRQIRIDLAAAYRLIHRLGLDDSIYTHISVRLPGRHDRFLINPYGLRFEEVTASNLVTVDLDGNIVEDPLGLGINPAGFTIHSAVHAARHDAICVLHTHTVAGVAVSSQKQGLLPLNQWSLQFTDRLAYHDYEGIALDLDERTRLVARPRRQVRHGPAQSRHAHLRTLRRRSVQADAQPGTLLPRAARDPGVRMPRSARCRQTSPAIRRSSTQASTTTSS